MQVATTKIEVGVRELKNHLSHYLERVRGGDEVIVTDRGHPVARLAGIDANVDRLADLIRSGAVRPPVRTTRSHPQPRVTVEGSTSDVVADQRR